MRPFSMEHQGTYNIIIRIKDNDKPEPISTTYRLFIVVKQNFNDKVVVDDLSN